MYITQLTDGVCDNMAGCICVVKSRCSHPMKRTIYHKRGEAFIAGVGRVQVWLTVEVQFISATLEPKTQ